MDKVKRLDRLAWLVQRVGGTVEGRKKLHKLVYLCQDRGLDFGQDFIFHEYGVYSPGLAWDLQQAVRWDVLREDQINARDMTMYRITLGEEAHPGAFDGDTAFVPALAEESASTLEVLGTVVYLARRGYDGAELMEALESLKGHLRNHFARALELAGTYFDIRL